MLNELSDILEGADRNPEAKALVIYSLKDNGFIAGADIQQFGALTDIEKASQFIRHGQHVFNKLEELTLPTIAMIEGFCMGGGLELALACRYRVAVSDDDKTRLALPEVRLGIHPGWGGTVRLPKLIGAPQALGLILTGRSVRAKKAAKIGLVDAAVPKRHLKRAVTRYALD